MISTAFHEDPALELRETELLQLFKLLADATRLRILLVLRDGELNVTEFCKHLEQSQPAVSHHLRLLRLSGLIHLRRSGKHNYYSLARDSRLRRIVSQLFEPQPPTTAAADKV